MHCSLLMGDISVAIFYGDFFFFFFATCFRQIMFFFCAKNNFSLHLATVAIGSANPAKGFSALAPGLYTCIKSLKMYIKSDFKEIILKLATYGQREKAFLLTSKFCPQWRNTENHRDNSGSKFYESKYLIYPNSMRNVSFQVRDLSFIEYKNTIFHEIFLPFTKF